MTSDAILSVAGLDVFYGASKILFGVDLEVGRGRTLALLGRNGAGKSTTLKAIAGVAPPRKGNVRLGTSDLAGSRPDAIARAGIGYVPEDRQVFPMHSVEDNLAIGAKLGPDGQDFWKLETVYETFPILARMKERRAGLMSGGEQQMLTIARALMTNPDLIILDEATEGLAPLIRLEIWVVIRHIKSTGIASIIVDKDINALLPICDRNYIINKGEVVYHGRSRELLENPELHKQYLGV